jgi:hypothetical protein
MTIKWEPASAEELAARKVPAAAKKPVKKPVAKKEA